MKKLMDYCIKLLCKIIDVVKLFFKKPIPPEIKEIKKKHSIHKQREKPKR